MTNEASETHARTAPHSDADPTPRDDETWDMSEPLQPFEDTDWPAAARELPGPWARIALGLGMFGAVGALTLTWN